MQKNLNKYKFPFPLWENSKDLITEKILKIANYYDSEPCLQNSRFLKCIARCSKFKQWNSFVQTAGNWLLSSLAGLREHCTVLRYCLLKFTSHEFKS